MAETQSVRVATFNASLNRPARGELLAELAGGGSRQAQRVAQVIQLVRPNVLALMELDYDGTQQALDVFHNQYLMQSWNGSTAVHYPYRRQFASNTGIPIPYDLNHDGTIARPEDAQGFGRHEGQYAFSILSQLPLAFEEARTFQTLLWSAMPENLLPIADEQTPTGIRGEAAAILRLSSKNHVDLRLTDSGVHLLLAHPTPPIFDGSERRNARRNHDEIRLLADYLSPDSSDYIVDDAGREGGLPASEEFIILGDMNADPFDGVSFRDAIWQLLSHPRVLEDSAYGLLTPASRGGLQNADRPMPDMPEAAAEDERRRPRGNASFHTTVWKLRVDYVLPSVGLPVRSTGVFWPTEEHQHAYLASGTATSDHRLVWADIGLF